jgi:Protein of unknown function (DUF4236)
VPYALRCMQAVPIVQPGRPRGQLQMQQEDANMSFLPGLRFRKSWGILPGVKFNVSKTGVSTSLGGHGATVNLGTRSRTATLGIPGTGLSYRVPLGGTVVVLILLAVAVVGIAWILQPELVGMVLHAWQPKLF